MSFALEGETTLLRPWKNNPWWREAALLLARRVEMEEIHGELSPSKEVGRSRLGFLPAHSCSGFQVVLVVKNPPANVGDLKRCSFNPWVRKIFWRRKWQPTLVFFPGNSMDRGTWQATVHRVAKSWTQLKRLTTHTHTHTFVLSPEMD